MVKFYSPRYLSPGQYLTAVILDTVSISFNMVSCAILEDYSPRGRQDFPARLGRSNRFVAPDLSMDRMLRVGENCRLQKVNPERTGYLNSSVSRYDAVPRSFQGRCFSVGNIHCNTSNVVHMLRALQTPDGRLK